MKRIILWGATGQAVVLREAVASLGFDLVALFDNNPDVESPFPDIPMVGGQAAFLQWRQDTRVSASSLVAIGGAKGEVRTKIQRFLERSGLPAATIVHRAAYVATDAVLSPGCQVLVGANVSARARLGYSCIVNSSASVDHECLLGDGVHIGPGAVLAGCVTVERFAFVGAGAVVLPRVHIGERAIVGAGAVVTKDVPSGTVAYGVPAEVRRRV